MADKKDGAPTISKGDAEKAGWQIAHVQEARAVKAGITGGGTTEVLVTDAVYRAERTYNDHLVTAQAPTEEALYEQIASQEASFASTPEAAPAFPVVNDNAGSADGNENAGIGAILTETAVEKPESARKLEEEQAERKEERSQAVKA